MTSKRSLTASAVVAGAAIAAGVAVSTLTDASASAASHGSFTVRAYHGSETNLDLGAKGFSAGDQDLGSDRLVRNGKQVGYSAISCTAVRVGATSTDQLCEFALRFGSSQLESRGVVRAGQAGPGTFTLPILGGTGRYEGATGQLTVTATDGPYVPMTVSLTGRG
jgi:hypothetical protein